MLETRLANDRKRPLRLAKAASPQFKRSVIALDIECDDSQLAAIALLSKPARHGYYLWGEVGRGKSMLADLFFDAVPTRLKQRFHFHTFFRDLQTEIIATRQPVEASIRTLIGEAQVVFFDEFHVHDVADALYLTKTLEALIELNVLVIATSNYAPEGLLPDPEFHDRFAPAIELITSRFKVVTLGDGVDYRREPGAQARTGFAAGTWRVTAAHLSAVPESDIELRVNGLAARAVEVEIVADQATAQFTFAELCEVPLGTREYLQLAEDFHSITLVAVPDLATALPSSLMRLSNLVDVFHHRDQRLDVESEAEPERMREAHVTPQDAARTLSRLATLTLVPARTANSHVAAARASYTL